jgi:hypothetical protein
MLVEQPSNKRVAKGVGVGHVLITQSPALDVLIKTMNVI